MQKLNTTLVYILSITGFICCCWFLGLGVIPTGIAFFIANKEYKKYEAQPEAYSNGPAMKTAKMVALIAFVICALFFLYSIFDVFTTPWDEVMGRYNSALESQGVEF